MAKTVSKDVQKLTDCIKDFFLLGATTPGSQKDEINKKQLAVDLAKFIAVRFNGTELYLSINEERIKRNLKILDMRERKNYTFKQISEILGLSTTAVHSVVMNHRTVTITGDFNE